MTVPDRLPTWEEAKAAVESGACTRLQKFIYDNEPGAPGDTEWRKELAELLADPEAVIDT